jgi:thymidylate synthase (FAD)
VSYEWLIKQGAAPELARLVMPLSMYTSFRVTASLWAVLYFISLRAQGEAQWEIQQYANAMREEVARLFPITYEAWINSLERMD